jgi:hypothetical protein
LANPNDPAQIANQALAPILAEIRRQQAEEDKRRRDAQATAGASAQGLSQVLGQIPGQIQGDYQKAADSTFEYGRQIGLQAATGSNEAAAGLNDFLGKQGAPGRVQASGDLGGQVLAGLSGLLPASALQREGAAFTAAARGLGPAALGRGQQEQLLIGRDSRDKRAQLDALLRQEKAKLPGLTSDIRAQQAELAVKNRAQKLNEAVAIENLGIRKGQLDVSKANAVTSRLNADTTAGSLKLRQQTERFDQLLSKAKLNLDQDQFELAIQREQRLAKPKPKGGFTAKQKQTMAQQALDTAEDDFRGYEEDGEAFPPRPPVETLRDLIASGVPFSIAIKAIQRFARGKKPADVDARTWALWRATLRWTKK